MNSPGERSRVEQILAAIGSSDSGALVGPGDDAAVVEFGGERLVLTVDTQREGVHYRTGWLDPVQLGRRALAVAVSDIGAMGATPRCSLAVLASGPTTASAWAAAVTRGIAAAGRLFGCPLVGGDLSISSTDEVAITVVGILDGGRQPLLRSGAMPGHECWVLGDLGMAAGGRAALEAGRGEDPQAAKLVRSWRQPTPPLALAAALGSSAIPAAMMDVSDGLGIDLERMCAASGCTARIESAALENPLLAEGAAALGGDWLDWTIAGGEDYSLLCAVPPGRVPELREMATKHGVLSRCIGHFLAGDQAPTLLVGERERSMGGGWDPFCETG